MKITTSCLKQLLEGATLPEPPTDSDYKAACVFLLIYNLDKHPQILAIQKADNEGYPWRNQVALPGGHVDKEDSGRLDAAYRELSEEVNIPPDHIEFIGSMGHFQTIFNRDVEVFIGLWNGKSHVKFDQTEISKTIEIPLEHLMGIHKKENFSGQLPGVTELLYPFQDVTVWGLTAKIFHFFIELMSPCISRSNNA